MNQVIDKARSVIANPDSSFEELAALIEKDQALAVNVLKIANSAYYRRINAAASIKEAVVVLGFETLDELITIACVSPHLHKRLKGYNIKADSIWWHSTIFILHEGNIIVPSILYFLRHYENSTFAIVAKIIRFGHKNAQ